MCYWLDVVASKPSRCRETADDEHRDERERVQHRDVRWIREPHSVASQLNTFTQDGSAIAIVLTMNNQGRVHARHEHGSPTVNRAAIAMIE